MRLSSRSTSAIRLATITSLVSGCLGAGSSPAYYSARQADLVSATATAFKRANLPLKEVAESTVRTPEFQATEVWSTEQIRERLTCGDISKRSSISSVKVSLVARVVEDPRSAEIRNAPAGSVTTRYYDSSLRISASGKMIADGKETKCGISSQFAQAMIDDIGMIVGTPARRTPAKQGGAREPLTIPAIPGRGGSPPVISVPNN